MNNLPPYDNPKRRAYERRKKTLLEVLGNKCAHCPAVSDLQFDCIQPCGPAHHGMGMYDRMIFYVLQQRSDNLQLLCPSCHQIKSAQDKFNLRQSALAEDALTSSGGTTESPSGGVSNAPQKSPLSRQPSETDWQWDCRRIRNQLGMD